MCKSLLNTLNTITNLVSSQHEVCTVCTMVRNTMANIQWGGHAGNDCKLFYLFTFLLYFMRQLYIFLFCWYLFLLYTISCIKRKNKMKWQNTTGEDVITWRNQTSCIKDDDENRIEMYDLDLLQDIYAGFCQRIRATIDWRRRCPLAKCYQPWALHRTEHTVRKKKQTKKPPNTHHTTHKSSYSRYAYACSHTNSHARTVPYARPSHTHLHPLYREPYVRVCGAAASYYTCGCATRLPRCSGLQAWVAVVM